MKTQKNNDMNINGALLSEELLNEICYFQGEDTAADYIEDIMNMQRFFIGYLGANMNDKSAIVYLGTLQRLHDFLKITVKGRMNDE
jgi:hypothetical protein